MLHSYDEMYVAKAQTALAQMVRYGVEDLHMELPAFWDMFLISGIADSWSECRGWRLHGKSYGG